MPAQLQVLAAGSNAHGQLANETLDDSHTLQACVFAGGDNVFQHQLPGDKLVSLASGANHTLLLLEVHSEGNRHELQLWGCGDSRHGQLGPASAGQQRSVFRRIDYDVLDAAGIAQGTHVIHAIAASWESSYIVLRSRQELRQNQRDIILSMGNNDFLDLGVDKSTTGHGPHRVALETAFEPYIVTGFQVMDIAAGPHQVVATVRLFLDKGAKDIVVGWGACRHGQLGTNLKPPSPKKTQATTGPKIISPERTHIDVDRDPITSIALGNYHTVLLHLSGQITGLGSNKRGQLAGLQAETGAKSVHCTWNGTYLILGMHLADREWEIRAIGSNNKGQLGYPPFLSGAAAPQVVHFPFNYTTHRLVGIACGSEHVLALFAVVDEKGRVKDGDNEVWGWGWNEHGNLGMGHTTDAHSPTKIWPRPGGAVTGKRVLGVWAGCGTSWIVAVQ